MEQSNQVPSTNPELNGQRDSERTSSADWNPYDFPVIPPKAPGTNFLGEPVEAMRPILTGLPFDVVEGIAAKHVVNTRGHNVCEPDMALRIAQDPSGQSQLCGEGNVVQSMRPLTYCHVAILHELDLQLRARGLGCVEEVPWVNDDYHYDDETVLITRHANYCISHTDASGIRLFNIVIPRVPEPDDGSCINYTRKMRMRELIFDNATAQACVLAGSHSHLTHVVSQYIEKTLELDSKSMACEVNSFLREENVEGLAAEVLTLAAAIVDGKSIEEQGGFVSGLMGVANSLTNLSSLATRVSDMLGSLTTVLSDCLYALVGVVAICIAFVLAHSKAITGAVATSLLVGAIGAWIYRNLPDACPQSKINPMHECTEFKVVGDPAQCGNKIGIMGRVKSTFSGMLDDIVGMMMALAGGISDVMSTVCEKVEEPYQRVARVLNSAKTKVGYRSADQSVVFEDESSELDEETQYQVWLDKYEQENPPPDGMVALNAYYVRARAKYACRLRETRDINMTEESYNLGSVLTSLGTILQIDILTAFKIIGATSLVIRGGREVASFIFGIVPAAVQAFLCKMFPALVDQIQYVGSGWAYHVKAMDESMARIEQFPDNEQYYKDAYMIGKVARERAKRITLPWGHRAQQLAEDHMRTVNAKALVKKYIVGGCRPTFFWFCGETRMGKTEAAMALASLIAASYAGKPAEDLIFVRPAGKYAEGMTQDKRVVVIKEALGATDEANLANVEDMMNIPDGAWQPNMAFADKGANYEVYNLIVASNYQVCPDIPGFSNKAALNARRTLVIQPLRNLDFPGVTPNMDTEAWMNLMKRATPEQKRDRDFIRYVFRDPIGTNDQARKLVHAPPVILDIINNPHHWANVNLQMKEGLFPGVVGDIDAALFRSKRWNWAQICMMCIVVAKEGLRAAADLNPRSELMDFAIECSAQRRVEIPKADNSNLIVNGFIAFCGAVAVATASGVLYRLYNALSGRKVLDDMEAEYGTRRRDIATRKIIANKPVAFDAQMGPAEEHLWDRLRTQLVTVVGGEEERSVYGLLIDESTLLTNYHMFLHVGEDAPLTLHLTRNGAVVTIPEVYNESRATVIKNQDGTLADICLYRLDYRVPGTRNIRGLFSQTTAHAVGTPVTRYTGTVVEQSEIAGMIKTGSFSAPTLKAIGQRNVYSYATSAKVGDCGSPIVAIVDGTHKIIGLHNARAHGVRVPGIFIPVSTAMLARSPPAAGELAPPPADLVMSAQMSVVPDFMPEGNFIPMGVSPVAYGTPPGTQLRPTPFKDALKQYPCRVGISKKDREGVLAIEAKYGQPKKRILKRDLDYGVRLAKRYLCGKTSRKRGPMDPQEVLQVDLTTSTGYGWRGVKRSSLITCNPDGTRTMAPALAARYNALKECYEAGSFPPAIFLPCPKDEILSLENIAKGKVRTFQMDTLEHYLLGRHYIGEFCEHITDIHLRSPIRVGLNVHSRDFHDVFADFVAHLDQDEVIDIDFSGYDRSLMPYLAAACCDVLDEFYQNKDPARRQWVMSNFFAIEVYGRAVWQRLQGVGSGMYGTSVVNSVIAIVLVGSAFKHCFPQATVEDFITNVLLNIYGDDNLVGPSKAVKRGGFNFNFLQVYFANLGVTITPAEKSATPTPFVKRTTTQFLKKRILWSEEFKGYVPIIPAHYVWDHLSYARDVSHYGLLQLANSLLGEYFFRGRIRESKEIPVEDPTFDEMRSLIGKCIGGLEGLVTYENLMQSYWDQSGLPVEDGLANDWEDISSGDSVEVLMIEESSPGSCVAVCDEQPFPEDPYWYGDFEVLMEDQGAGQSSSIYYDMRGAEGNTVGAANASGSATTEISPSVSASAAYKGNSGDASSAATRNQPHREVDTSGAPSDLNFRGKGENLAAGFKPAKYVGGVAPKKSEEKTADKPTNWIAPINVESNATLLPSIDGPSHGVFLSDKVATDTVATAGDFCSMEDVSALSWWTRRWGLVDNLHLDYAASAGTLVASYPLTPFQTLKPGASYNVGYQLSPLEFAASLFRHWRGGLEYKLNIAGPAQIAGRLAICLGYLDYGADPGYQTAVTGPSVIWDFDSMNREKVVRCDYINPAKWLVPPYVLQDANAPVGIGMNSSLGTMRIYLVTKVTTPNAVFSGPPLMVLSHRGSPTFETELYNPCPLSLAPCPAPTVVPTIDEGIGMEAQMSGGAGTTVLDVEAKHTAVASEPVGEQALAVPITLQKFAYKYANLRTVTIDSSVITNVLALQHPGQTLVAQANYSQAAMKLYRGDLHVRAFPRGNGWQGTLAYLWYEPYGDVGSVRKPRRFLSMPGVFIDLSSSEPVELVVPYSYYRDYFYEGCPPAGIVRIDMVDPIQYPTTGGSSVDIEVTAAWSKFESFVPKEIGDSGPFIMEAQMSEGLKSSSAEETTAQTELVQLNQGERPVEPILSRHLVIRSQTARNAFDALKRPMPMLFKQVDVAGRKTTLIDLTALANHWNVSGTLSSSMFDILSNCFALQKGDMVFDIYVKAASDETKVERRAWVFTTYSPYEISVGGDPSSTLLSYLPRADLSVYPSCSSASAPYAFNQAAPVTTADVPCHFRVVEPYMSQFNANLASGLAQPAVDQVSAGTRTYLALWSSLTEVMDVEVWRSVGDSFRFGTFTGIPTLYLSSLKSGADVLPMPDVLFV